MMQFSDSPLAPVCRSYLKRVRLSRLGFRVDLPCFTALLLALLLCIGYTAATAQAAVAVISNRTPADIRFTIIASPASEPTSQPKSYTVGSGDITVVPLQRGEAARLTTDSAAYSVEPDAAYYFGALPSGKVDFARIGLENMPPEASGPDAGSRPPASHQNPEADEAARTITVKILVDDDEPSTRAVWEHRYRERIAAASDILERTCGIKLKVVDVGTFHIERSVIDFNSAVNEFIRTVDPGEARVAIGFTGRYQQNVQGITHMGGTKGPLARHILVREWSRHFSETEDLEFLLHEVGHFMGAVHSPESDAVMRPRLGDRQSRARRFTIHFDPLNALAINLVAEEMREHPIRSFADLSPPTRARLRAIYEQINQAMPDDPAPREYLRILNGVTRTQPTGLR